MPPWLLFGLLVSLLAALGYQIVRVTSLRRVPLYWLVTSIAFLAAEAFAESSHLVLVRLGELAIIPDILGVLIGLAALRLSRL